MIYRRLLLFLSLHFSESDSDDDLDISISPFPLLSSSALASSSAPRSSAPALPSLDETDLQLPELPKVWTLQIQRSKVGGCGNLSMDKSVSVYSAAGCLHRCLPKTFLA
jgi:hypothetical protein